MSPNVCLLNVVFDPSVGNRSIEEVHTLIKENYGRMFGHPAKNEDTGSYEVLFVVDKTRSITRRLKNHPDIIKVEEMLDHIT